MIEYQARPAKHVGYHAQHRGRYDEYTGRWLPKPCYAIWRPTPHWAISALQRKDKRMKTATSRRRQRRIDRARRASRR